MTVVVHVISGLARGGAETVLYRYLNNLSEEARQHHVVISLGSCGFFGDKLEALGISVHALGMGGLWSWPGAFAKLVKIMRLARPDVVQTWLYHADLLGGLAAKLSGKPPVIWGVHTVNLPTSTAKPTMAVRRLCALMSRWLPHSIICVARATMEKHAALGYDRARMHIVPNGFDLPNLETLEFDARLLRQSLGLESHHRVVGCVGRFHPDKDYRTFLQAASLLKEQCPNVRFMLVGRGLTSDNVELSDWIAEGGLGDCIHTLGERNDISACMAAMDVFCLPSQTEAFPLVLGEAMAAARPVVSTDVGDAAFLVGGTGTIVPPRSPQALSQGLKRMLNLSELARKELGLSSRERIKDNFSIQFFLARMQDLYQSIT